MTMTQTQPLPRQLDSSSAAELAAIVDAYTDVTEKLKRSHERLTAEVRRLSDQLDEKNRELAKRERLAALGEMAAGMAHEIRNPLAGIQLFASLLERDLDKRAAPDAAQPSGAELVRRISAAVQTLDGVVSEILVFAGEAPFLPTPVDVYDIIRDVSALAAPLAEARRVTLHIDAPSGDAPLARPHVLADPSQIQRALLNLVRNAIEAVEPDGRVWTHAAPANLRAAGGGQDCDRVRLSVADDGPGVPDEHQQRIFNPFFTTRADGTGLGLSIVHRIVEAHGGCMAVGRRDGGGAVFSFTLPRAPESSVAPGAPDSRSNTWPVSV